MQLINNNFKYKILSELFLLKIILIKVRSNDNKLIQVPVVENKYGKKKSYSYFIIEINNCSCKNVK